MEQWLQETIKVFAGVTAIMTPVTVAYVKIKMANGKPKKNSGYYVKKEVWQEWKTGHEIWKKSMEKQITGLSQRFDRFESNTSVKFDKFETNIQKKFDDLIQTILQMYSHDHKKSND